MSLRASHPKGGNSWMIEQLERRRLMSGDVVVRLEDGWLRVEGDESDNVVIVERSGSDPAAVVVRGEGGTTLNGAAKDLIFSGAADGLRLRARLGRGDDRLTIIGLDSAASAWLNLGGGKDETRVEVVALSGDFRLRDVLGRSVALLDRLTVGGSAEIASGDAADSLAIRHSDFRGVASISTDAADDYVRVRRTTFAQNIPINDGDGDDHIDRELIFAWDFRQGAQGWTPDYADTPYSLPDGTVKDQYRIRSGIEPLPAGIGLVGDGFVQSSLNSSDDIFMYMFRRLSGADGLSAAEEYMLTFDIRFASDAPAGLAGWGGPRAESVIVKAGGVPREPAIIVEDNDRLINVDKGNQSNGGSEMSVAGDIRNGLGEDGTIYNIVQRKHTHSQPVRADRAGRLWIIVGTDSGNEGIVTLYYTRISVRLTPVAS